MSKVTKEDMKEWLCGAGRESWKINDPYDSIGAAILALIEKYGDLTDDVVTATSIVMEEERKKKTGEFKKLVEAAKEGVQEIINRQHTLEYNGKKYDHARIIINNLNIALAPFLQWGIM